MNNLKFFIGCVFVLISINVSAQIITNKTELRDCSLNSVPCNPNCFWMIHVDQSNASIYNIREYNLANNTITQTGNNIYNVPNANLAYCNDFNNPSSRTFYNIDSYQSNNILKYDNGMWSPITSNSLNLSFFNPGGNGNVLAFQGRDNSIWPKFICTFNGTTIDSIYYCGPNYSLIGADIAVDSLGQIWFFESNDTSYFNPVCLKVISSTGVVIKSYPITTTIDFSDCYGVMILNNTLYVGISYLNSTYSNKLLPFTIINDSIFLNTPIPFIAPPQKKDLESCNQGTLTSISEVPESLKELAVYPNPAQEQFMLHLPYRTSSNAIIQIYNLHGEIVKTIKGSDTSPINCSTWPRGIYFVSLVEEGKARVTRKVVVI